VYNTAVISAGFKQIQPLWRGFLSRHANAAFLLQDPRYLVSCNPLCCYTGMVITQLKLACVQRAMSDMHAAALGMCKTMPCILPSYPACLLPRHALQQHLCCCLHKRQCICCCDYIPECCHCQPLSFFMHCPRLHTTSHPAHCVSLPPPHPTQACRQLLLTACSKSPLMPMLSSS
jgi:hypothetical protein